MGQELARKYPAAASVFSLCDTIRPGTSMQCFRGTEEELKETKNTQPCLFAVELASGPMRQQGFPWEKWLRQYPPASLTWRQGFAWYANGES